ncbi:hypothetical protein MSG28_001405 [Choristoneura fumiferana]|uniref:Uncharacterized protein n=1 Tax=Choristoneura fumiferana TaxID=7141 RepID=A0ACC0KUJ4_CHOFU|nr:hypothetical protein MSG28_001405 [Choristoneura fumiferana]
MVSLSTVSSAQRELGKGPANASATAPPAGSADNAIRGASDPRPTPRTGPYFDPVASKNVTALLGKTAYLNCRVKNLGNKTYTAASTRQDSCREPMEGASRVSGRGIDNAIRGASDSRLTLRTGPYFDPVASKNVTALLGKTAYLNCRVKNLGDQTASQSLCTPRFINMQVSWVRHRDIHLLTVGRYTYTSDQRFRAIHLPHTEDWTLQIKYPQHRDSGIYECQISTTPHMSHFIHLNVVEPTTEIIGGPDLYIDRGSTINLTCVVLYSPEPPAYIFWNHNDAIISYDSPRGGVSVVTEKGETTTSFLLIQQARPSDSGTYQCNPSNAQSKSIVVHVLNGEYPAAMQRGGQAFAPTSPTHCLVLVACLFIALS